MVCYKFPRYTKSTFGTFGKNKGKGGLCSQILPKNQKYRKIMIRYFSKSIPPPRLDISKTFYARSDGFAKSYGFAEDIMTSSISSAVGAKPVQIL